jgi:hypothetical protein
MFMGMSYYLGEINPSLQFYKPSFAAGGILRWILNGRYALRGQVNYGRFSASDFDFNNEYQRDRGASFSQSIIDLHIVAEYNFLPFVYDPRKVVISPYLFVGAGYAFVLSSTVNNKSHFDIPFGIGVKYMMLKNVNVGFEWSFRKNFTDQVDGLVNPGGEIYHSSFFNKDTYSFAGIFITFGLFGGSRNCPVYQ